MSRGGAGRRFRFGHGRSSPTRLLEPTTNVANVIPVGRNGMHRYNNQDHSMLTAMLAVENLLGADHDLWSVNADDDYHEVASPRTSASKAAPGGVARRSSVGVSSRIPTK